MRTKRLITTGSRLGLALRVLGAEGLSPSELTARFSAPDDRGGQ